MWYYLDRSFDEITNLSQIERYRATWKRSLVMLDEAQLTASERTVFEGLLKQHPVIFYDHYALVDLRSDKPGASSYAFKSGPMSASYRWLVSHRYAPLGLERRGYLPGLCAAVALGVPVARDEALPSPPRDWKQLGCWRDYLRARGDDGRAAEAERQMRQNLAATDRPLGKAHVVAAGIVGGRLRVLVAAGGPEGGELRYAVRDARGVVTYQARVVAPPPSSWRAGSLYLDEVPLGSARPPVDVDVELWKAAPKAPPIPPPPWERVPAAPLPYHPSPPFTPPPAVARVDLRVPSKPPLRPTLHAPPQQLPAPPPAPAVVLSRAALGRLP
jgi:hypothetical protein